jgi:hypothetical protein
MDESSYAYLLGLYLGDGHIVHGPRDVYVLAIACSDDWPGLMAAARGAMAAVMPASSVCGVKQTGCTMIKSYSQHWARLFPQHGPGRKHQRKIELAHWQEVIVRKYPGEFARGLFHSDGWRGVNRVHRMLADGEHWYEYPRYVFGNESADILAHVLELLRDRLHVALAQLAAEQGEQRDVVDVGYALGIAGPQLLDNRAEEGWQRHVREPSR